MADIWMDVDTAVTVPVNVAPIVDSTTGATIDETIAYNETGMDLNWNFVTTAGVITQTNITPTTGGDYDFTMSAMVYIKLNFRHLGALRQTMTLKALAGLPGRPTQYYPPEGR